MKKQFHHKPAPVLSGKVCQFCGTPLMIWELIHGEACGPCFKLNKDNLIRKGNF